MPSCIEDFQKVVYKRSYVKVAHTDASFDNKCHFECLVSKQYKHTIMFVSSEKHMNGRSKKYS